MIKTLQTINTTAVKQPRTPFVSFTKFDLVRPELFFIHSSIILVSLMNTYKTGFLKWTSFLAYFVTLLAATLPRLISLIFSHNSTSIPRLTSIPIWFFLYLFIILIGYGRSINVTSISNLSLNSLLFFLTIGFFIIISIWPATIRRDQRYPKAVLQSVDIFLLCNFIGYILGLKGDSSFINSGDFGSGKLLALIGVDHERVLFPFSPGLLSFGVLAGMSFCNATLGAFGSYSKNKPYDFFMLIVSFLSLLLADARGAIFFSFSALGVYFLFIRIRISAAKYLILPLSLFFLFIITVCLVLSRYDIFMNLSRGGGLLSGREIVWFFAFEYLKEYNPIMLVGHGFMGHLKSGVSYSYSFLFDNWGTNNPEFATLHNFLLQSLWDIGIIGAIVLIMTLITSINIASKSESLSPDLSRRIILFICYVILAGSTESSINPYSFISFMPILFMVGYLNLQPSILNPKVSM